MAEAASGCDRRRPLRLVLCFILARIAPPLVLERNGTDEALGLKTPIDLGVGKPAFDQPAA